MKTKSLTFAAVIAGITFIVASLNAAHTPDPWERQIVASCLILEASDQGMEGMTAVANVIENRAYGNSRKFLKVVRRPYAFSSLNKATTGKTGARGYADHVRRASRDQNWRVALNIVDQLYAGTLNDITYGATHFSIKQEYVTWMKDMQLTVVIGDHKFLRKG